MPAPNRPPSPPARLHLAALIAAVLGAALVGPAPAGAEPAIDPGAPPREGATPMKNEDDLRAAVQHLEPPRRGVSNVRALKVTLWQTDTEPWREIPIDDLRSGAFTPDDGHSYALAGVLSCSEMYVGGAWQGEKIAWYLLPKNRIVAFDHYDFAEQCAVHNQYQPALAQLVPVENALLARLAKMFPPSHQHRTELYRKGLSLVRVGRLDDAEARLRQADESVDVGFGSPYDAPRPAPGRGSQMVTEKETASVRADLVAALERARSGAPAADGTSPANTAVANPALPTIRPAAVPPALTPREALLDLPMPEFAAAAEHAPLVSVAAYGLNGQPRFSAIRDVKGAPGRRALSEVPPAQVPATLDGLARDGYRVVEVCGYLVDSREAMALVAEKNEPPLVTEVRPAMTATEVATTDAELTAKGFRMQRLCGYGVGGDARFAAIWARAAGPAVRWLVDLTPQKLRKEIDAAPAAGWTPRDFGGYIVAGDDRYVLLLEQGTGPGWEALALIDGAAVARKIALGERKGLTPAVLRASVFAGDDIRYSLLLRSPADVRAE